MKLMQRLAVVVLMMAGCVAAWADSPLTSTDFSAAYADHPMVEMAGDSMELVEQCIMKNCKAKDEQQLVKKADAGALIVYAYAKAMGDYFNVVDAQAIAHEAVKKNKGKSFSIDFVASLIDAQWCLDNDIEHLYGVVYEVINEYGDRQDMRTEAVNIVMDYIGLYTE